MEEVLEKILTAEFGKENYAFTSRALKRWSDAIECFTPTDQDQYGAFRVGPSFPFAITDAPAIPENTGAMFGGRICSTNFKTRPDKRNSVFSIRVHDEVESLERMLGLMEQGIAALEQAPVENTNLTELLNLGRFIRNTVVTGIHAKQWYILKSKLNSETSKSELEKIVDKMTALLQNELENTKATIPLVVEDSRLGWEPSMLYMTDKWHLEWKIRQVEYTLQYEMVEYKQSLMK